MSTPMHMVGKEARAVFRGDTATHVHLRERIAAIWLVTLTLDLVASVLVFVFERNKVQGYGIHTFGDAVFWTTAQLLTVSSQMGNPVTTLGKILDLVLEFWAITAVTALAGSFGAFFHRRGMERDPM